MSRLPVRLRLTLPFAAAMSVGLAAMGLFIYLRVGGTMLSSVDQNLRAQVDEATHNVAEEHSQPHRPGRQQRPDDRAARARRRLGRRVGAAAAAAAGPRRRRRDGSESRGRSRGCVARGESRSLPSGSTGLRPRSIVGRSLAARAETLDRLGHEFLLAAPVALLLALVAGYGLAAAALRPVEAMRRRAAAVTAATPGRRLPVPPARDEISALAVTLNDMLARLEASFEHERRFVADASHELRTPLALLKAELELALRRPRSREELESALASAAEETERLTRLAEDLLLIARADQGRLPIRPERLQRVRGPRPGPRALRRPRCVARARHSSSTSKRTPSSSQTRCGSSRRSATSSTTPWSTAPVLVTLGARARERPRRVVRRRRGGGAAAGLHRARLRPVRPPRRRPQLRRDRSRPVDRRADRRRARRRRARREPPRRRHRDLALAAAAGAPGQARRTILSSIRHSSLLIAISCGESTGGPEMTADEHSIGRAAAAARRSDRANTEDDRRGRCARGRPDGGLHRASPPRPPTRATHVVRSPQTRRPTQAAVVAPAPALVPVAGRGDDGSLDPPSPAPPAPAPAPAPVAVPPVVSSGGS